MHNRIPATLAVTIMFVILLLNQVSADSFYPNAGVDVTDEATPLELHHYQLLFNYEHDEFNYVAPLGIPEISVKYGVTRNFDVGIQLPYMIDYQDINGLSGYGDVSFGFKYLLTPLGEKRLLASLIGSMKVYSADFSKELSDGATDYSIHAAFSYEMEKWKYHLNYGYTFWGSIPGYDTKPSPYYRFKTDYVSSEQWSFSAELYGTGSPNLDYIGAPMQSTVKTTWQVNDSLSFDLGMAFGLNPDAPVRRYLFSITYEH
jgi:hypothetical protein